MTDVEDGAKPSKELRKRRRRYLKERDEVQPDSMLATLVEAAEESAGTEISVTLAVRGSVVSGVLVGRTAWIDRQIGSNEDLKFLTGWRKAWAEQAEQYQRRKEADPDTLRPYEVMVHLVDAYYEFGDGRTVPGAGEGFYWRGRLSSIDGWSFGMTARFDPDA